MQPVSNGLVLLVLCSRRAEDRRRRRISEEQADEADRLAEQEEMAAKRQRGEVSDEGSKCLVLFSVEVYGFRDCHKALTRVLRRKAIGGCSSCILVLRVLHVSND